ncbi:ABC transporter [candidate division WOR_3 bacterium SM23_60]|jgi:ABC-2 type transport system permease protein|uniref:Transport permease protein n=1 Tax=candidate division WOR_3 bacterium SM23_60 TaxID=1703780 RepID=A0A0S8GJJ9_UNCW3|nr:MAG: ABC transporter [candidate division WOR_3 bacterium SM23_60]
MDWNTIYIVWLRELIRYIRQRSRLYGSIVRPILWLFILGMGLRPSFQSVQGFNYTQYIFPGIIAMTLIFTSIQSAISIIWDREFGFLKEILVAPVPRTAIALGKAFAGSTLSVMQGTIILIFAPLVKVPIIWYRILMLIPVMFLISFALVGIGIVIASRMTSFEGFGTIMNFLVMPMFFLSGAMFPISGLPPWLKTVIVINPLSYGVDLLRTIILGISTFPIVLDCGFLLAFGVTAIFFAILFFNRGEY